MNEDVSHSMIYNTKTRNVPKIKSIEQSNKWYFSNIINMMQHKESYFEEYLKTLAINFSKDK